MPPRRSLIAEKQESAVLIEDGVTPPEQSGNNAALAPGVDPTQPDGAAPAPARRKRFERRTEPLAPAEPISTAANGAQAIGEALSGIQPIAESLNAVEAGGSYVAERTSRVVERTERPSRVVER